MRLIDADELYGRLAFDFEMLRNGALEKLSPDDVLETIHEQPTIDPVKHGRWICVGFMEVECSECSETFHELESTNYCPNCGARMDDVKMSDDEKELIGKTIVYAEIGGYGLTLKFSDGSILDYCSSDGGYSSWEIIDDAEQEERD